MILMDLKNFYKQYIKRVMDILCSFFVSCSILVVTCISCFFSKN